MRKNQPIATSVPAAHAVCAPGVMVLLVLVCALLTVTVSNSKETPLLTAQFDPSICSPFVWRTSLSLAQPPPINGSYVLSLTSSKPSHLHQLFHQILQLTKLTSLPISIIVLSSLPHIQSLVHNIHSYLLSLAHLPSLTQQVTLYQLPHPLEHNILRQSYLRLLRSSYPYSNPNEFFKLVLFSSLPYERLLYLHSSLQIIKPIDHLLACSPHSDLFFTNALTTFFDKSFFVVRGGDRALYDDMMEALVSYTWKLRAIHPYQTAFQEFLYFYFVIRPTLSPPRSSPMLRVHRLSSCLYNYQKFPKSLCLSDFFQSLPSHSHPHNGTSSGVSPYIINQYSPWLHRELHPSLPSSTAPPPRPSISSFNPHRLSMDKPCLPNFWIVGARKSGTTALYTWLTEHPHVAPLNLRHEPTDGEVMVPLTTTNLARYNRLFKEEMRRIEVDTSVRNVSSSGAPSLLVGDAWVGRFLNEDYRAISTLCYERNIKVLLILRDPIERCVSQWKMRYRREAAKKKQQAPDTLTSMANSAYDINEILEKELRDYLFHATATASSKTTPPDMSLPLLPVSLNNWKGSENCLYEGMYSVHLRRWLVVHGIDRLRVYFTDDLETAPREVITDALRFIGVKDTSVGLWEYDPVRHSKRFAPNRDEANVTVSLNGELRTRLEAVFGESNRELERLLGIERVPWGY
jgi:hypothetical protein